MRTSKWAIFAYVVVIIFGCIAALPNVLSPAQREQFGAWLPVKPVTLGLDLKGGSHLVLEVDAAGLRKARLETLLDDTRRALRGERIPASSARISGDAVTVKIDDPADLEKALPKLKELAALSARSVSVVRPRISKSPRTVATLAWQ